MRRVLDLPAIPRLSGTEKRRVNLAHDVHRAAKLLNLYAPSCDEAARVARVLHGLVDDLLSTDSARIAADPQSTGLQTPKGKK